MLVIINDSPKVFSKKVRAIVGRYAWRISRDIWIWPKSSIRFNIIQELQSQDKGISVILLWSDKKKEFGFSFHIHGAHPNCHTEHGFFNHAAGLDD